MNKSFVFLSIACASALALADTEQWQKPWFKGIGSEVTVKTDMKATNGSWNIADLEGATIKEGKLDIDLESNEEAMFTVGSTAAGDTDTLQRINIKAVFTPIKPTDLVAGAEMVAKEAQVGFAVVKIDDAPTYQYYAWVGAEGASAAIDDWVALTGVTPTADGETDLQIDIARWIPKAPKATFSVKVNEKVNDAYVARYVALENGSSESALPITSTATTVSSVACTGSGTISAVDGSVQYGVASFLGCKYGTADAAIAAAAEATGAENPTVELLRDASGNVTAKNGIAIADNGHEATIDMKDVTDPLPVKPTAAEFTEATLKGKSGDYTLKVKVSADNLSKVDIVLPDAVAQYKQVKPGSATAVSSGIQVTLETKNDNIPSVSTLDLSKKREFLAVHCTEAYEKADSTRASIESALTAEASNKLTYEQCYELAVKPTDSIKPVNVAKDEDTENITLSIPTIGQQSWKGAYTYKYQVKKGGSVVENCSNLTAPKIPLSAGSGTFTIEVVPTPVAD